MKLLKILKIIGQTLLFLIVGHVLVIVPEQYYCGTGDIYTALIIVLMCLYILVKLLYAIEKTWDFKKVFNRGYDIGQGDLSGKIHAINVINTLEGESHNLPICGTNEVVWKIDHNNVYPTCLDCLDTLKDK